jgi:hypothetical protein
VTAPIVFQPEHDGTLTLESAVGQAVGAASMCWEFVDAAGVFDDVRAGLVVDALLTFLREHGYAPGGDALEAVPVAPAASRVEVTQMSQDEFRTAADRALARLGLTLPELAEMAGRDDFVSLSAKKLWLALGAMG